MTEAVGPAVPDRAEPESSTDRPSGTGQTRTRPRIEAQLSVFALTYAIPAIGLLWGPGPTYEEGVVLVGGEFAARGLVPQRDFFTLYGPMATELTGLIMRVLGQSLMTERLIGLALIAAMLAAVLDIARTLVRSATVQLVAFGTAGLLSVAVGVIAPAAWWWALASLLWGTALLIRWSPSGPKVNGGWRADRLGIAGAALVVGSSSFRPDMAVMAAAILGLIVAGRKATVRPVLIGAVLGALPMAIHIGRIGLSAAYRWMFYVPVVQLRPFRRLPVPPSWSKYDSSVLELLPKNRGVPWAPFGRPQQLSLWFWWILLTTVAIILLAVWDWRRGRRWSRSALAVGLVVCGLTPQLLQRPDLAHCYMVSAITTPFLILLVARRMERQPDTRGREVIIASALALGLVGIVAPAFTLANWFDALLWRPRQDAAAVEHDGRKILVSEPQAAALQPVVDALGQEAQPGDTLIVAPADLARSKANDVIVYHLFADLRPGTFWVEINPGVTNAPDSTFATELAHADWLITTEFASGWVEPNRSVDPIAPELDQIVEDSFCRVDTESEYASLYRRCDHDR